MKTTKRTTTRTLQPAPMGRDGRNAQIAAHYEALRPLLLDAGDDNVTAAVKRYDAALLAVHNSPGRQHRERAAETALQAEIRAAAAERRPPALDRRSVDTAREEDSYEVQYIAALTAEQMKHADALQQAVFDGAGRLLHVLAAEYFRTPPVVLPTGQQLSCPQHLQALWTSIGWPPLYEGAGEIRVDMNASTQLKTYRAAMWWPVPVPGYWYGHNDALRQSWYTHVLEQLARPRRKGYTFTDAGELRLSERWNPPRGRQVFGHGESPRLLGADAVAWIGGADGVTSEDLGRPLQPVTFGLPA